jgi:pyruvate kinase
MDGVRRTKIICTLGPAVDTEEAVRGLLEAGMNVARFNFSHGTHEEHRERIGRLRRVSEETGIPVALLLDTKGPEIRTGMLEPGVELELAVGDTIVVTTDDVLGNRDRVSISYKELPGEVLPGNHLFVADGLIDLEVVSVEGNDIACRVCSGGTLGSRKNVNIPGVRVQLPAITEKDRLDILFAIDEGMDFIAASFIRKPADVDQIQQILREHNSSI